MRLNPRKEFMAEAVSQFIDIENREVSGRSPARSRSLRIGA